MNKQDDRNGRVPAGEVTKAHGAAAIALAAAVVIDCHNLPSSSTPGSFAGKCNAVAEQTRNSSFLHDDKCEEELILCIVRRDNDCHMKLASSETHEMHRVPLSVAGAEHSQPVSFASPFEQQRVDSFSALPSD